MNYIKLKNTCIFSLLFTTIFFISLLTPSSIIFSNESTENKEHLLKCAFISIEKDEREVEIARNNTTILMYSKMGEALAIRTIILESDILVNGVLENSEELERNISETKQLKEGIKELKTKIKTINVDQVTLKNELSDINESFESNSCKEVELTINDYYESCELNEEIYDTINCQVYRKAKEKTQSRT